jgi:hypothetical protein
VTLNDPVYVECAEALVKRAVSDTRKAAAGETVIESTAVDVIAWMYTAVTQRRPSELELNELSSLYADLHPDVSASESQIDEAAMAIVASTIMNLDRALTK